MIFRLLLEVWGDPLSALCTIIVSLIHRLQLGGLCAEDRPLLGRVAVTMLIKRLFVCLSGPHAFVGSRREVAMGVRWAGCAWGATV